MANVTIQDILKEIKLCVASSDLCKWVSDDILKWCVVFPVVCHYLPLSTISKRDYVDNFGQW